MRRRDGMRRTNVGEKIMKIAISDCLVDVCMNNADWYLLPRTGLRMMDGIYKHKKIKNKRLTKHNFFNKKVLF